MQFKVDSRQFTVVNAQLVALLRIAINRKKGDCWAELSADGDERWDELEN
jgi:hypothetical protein